MSKIPTNTEIINLLLEEDANNIQEHEEIIHMLLDKTFSKNLNSSQTETVLSEFWVLFDIKMRWRFKISSQRILY
ncbi:MAG TPA: hypothetical protein VIK78_05075 [Ruminiclostridium sp.]